LNDQPFSIAKNALEALQSLRQTSAPIRLWVDAVCINQNDIQERNHQVGLMGDIYRNAAHVIICCGQNHSVTRL
jgi:glycyl-tRNA synthetase beta subunit